MLYVRKYTLVQAWKIPPAGKPADEVMPPWLVKLIQLGDVHINSLGGLATFTRFGNRSSNPGDFILLSEEGEVDFCSETDFSERFELLGVAQAA